MTQIIETTQAVWSLYHILPPRPQFPALDLPRAAPSRARAMASRAALAQGFQERYARACASSSFFCSDGPEMGSRLKRARHHARAHEPCSHHMSLPRGAPSLSVPMGTTRAKETGCFARARACCGGAGFGRLSSSAEPRNARVTSAGGGERRQHRGITSGGRAGRLVGLLRARVCANSSASRAGSSSGSVGRDGDAPPTRARPIRINYTLLARRGVRVGCVWWYRADAITRHGSRGSLPTKPGSS